jgi:hypothetical protein
MQLISMGHQVEFMTRYSTSLSAQLRSDIGGSLTAAKVVADNVPFLALPPTSMSPPVYLNGTEDLWGMPTDLGFVSMVFDPSSMRRSEIIVNAHLAGLFGMHREEYLARAAARDLPVPLTELDGLLVLLFMAVREFVPGAARDEVFFRMRGGRGVGQHGFLVSLRTTVVLDAAGRVGEVRTEIPRQTLANAHCSTHERAVFDCRRSAPAPRPL